MANTCKYCGIDIDGEAEMFSQDKTFTRHSCRVTEQARKRANDSCDTPFDNLPEELQRQFLQQAEKDLGEE